MGFPGGLPASTGDLGSISGLGRSPGEGNDNPLQDSCLGNSLDRGAWQATVHRVAKSQIWLSTSTPLDLNLGEFVRFIQKNRLRGRSKRESWKFKGRESLTKGSQLRGRWKRIELKSAWYEKGNSVEMKKQASWEEEKGNRKKWAQNRRTEEELSSLASPSVSFHNTLTYLRSFYLIIFLFYFLYKVSICCMSFRSCCIGSSWKKTFWFCT